MQLFPFSLFLLVLVFLALNFFILWNVGSSVVSDTGLSAVSVERKQCHIHVAGTLHPSKVLCNIKATQIFNVKSLPFVMNGMPTFISSMGIMLSGNCSSSKIRLCWITEWRKYTAHVSTCSWSYAILYVKLQVPAFTSWCFWWRGVMLLSFTLCFLAFFFFLCWCLVGGC